MKPPVLVHLIQSPIISIKESCVSVIVCAGRAVLWEEGGNYALPSQLASRCNTRKLQMDAFG